jgi:hypothetical protein
VNEILQLKAACLEFALKTTVQYVPPANEEEVMAIATKYYEFLTGANNV